MRVTLIASTALNFNRTADLISGTAMADEILHGTEGDADTLAEFAGRACYKAWDRKNPATATTEGYLKNILDQGHYSVLEHASVTFYVEGVSRSLLLELERHRFLSFSVESQRYVDQLESHPDPVMPPLLRGSPRAMIVHRAYAAARQAYRELTTDVLNHYPKATKKQAREAARAVLPNCTPVDFVVTGNLRCWRDVLGKRYHEAADAEIQEFAAEVLKHLREIAPHGFQDIPDEPWGK